MFQRVKGAVQNAVGEMQEGVGEVVGDDELRVDGKGNQLAGQTRMWTDEALDQVRGLARTNPIATLAVVGGLAFFVGAAFSGAFTSRRGR